MVVEDEPLLLAAITKKLDKSGITTVPCRQGQIALDYLRSAVPDAIWLDYYLPDLNGLQFVAKVKQDPRLAAIPVLVVSNSASPDKVNSMLALGVKQYLLKAEYRLDDIINIITKLVAPK